jgi:hypothetical protein
MILFKLVAAIFLFDVSFFLEICFVEGVIQQRHLSVYLSVLRLL